MAEPKLCGRAAGAMSRSAECMPAEGLSAMKLQKPALPTKKFQVWTASGIKTKVMWGELIFHGRRVYIDQITGTLYDAKTGESASPFLFILFDGKPPKEPPVRKYREFDGLIKY